MSAKKWDIEIGSGKAQTGFNFKELYRYRDLLFLFVHRDFVSLYKQTILGPIWVVIQPILTSITFTIVFSRIAHIETGVAPLLFYLIGITIWNYFSDGVLKTSETFTSNQNIFGKVYFPRLIVPLSIIITNMIKFTIQFVFFISVYFYFLFFTDADFFFDWHLILIPVLLIMMASLGLGLGLVIAALTTRYRDLRFLIQFGIQLLMFASPVVYPLQIVPEIYRWILVLNPMTSIIETFKCGFFGSEYGVFDWGYLAYSFIMSFLILLIGMKLFGKVERSFMDTI